MHSECDRVGAHRADRIIRSTTIILIIKTKQIAGRRRGTRRPRTTYSSRLRVRRFVCDLLKQSETIGEFRRRRARAGRETRAVYEIVEIIRRNDKHETINTKLWCKHVTHILYCLFFRRSFVISCREAAGAAGAALLRFRPRGERSEYELFQRIDSMYDCTFRVLLFY